MCQAMVRRNWRVVIRQGAPSGAGGMTGRVQMVAIGVELADDLGRDVRLGAGLEGQDGPEGVAAAGGGCAGRQLFQHPDRLGDGGDGDPLRRLAVARFILVGDRSDAVAFDHAIGAAGHRQAARPHGLDLAIAHAGEIGADHIAGGLEHALLMHERLRIEARSPE